MNVFYNRTVMWHSKRNWIKSEMFCFFCTILRHIKIEIKYQCGVRILLYGGRQQKKIIIQMDNRNSHTHQEQNQVILGISISYYLVPVQTGHSVVWQTNSYRVETLTLDTSIQLDVFWYHFLFLDWSFIIVLFYIHTCIPNYIDFL